METIKIKKLLEEKAEPCVSIIIPLHRTSPDRIKDSKTVQIAVGQVKIFLKQKYIEKDQDHVIDNMIKEIDKVVEKIDFSHSKDGIGIYISPYTSQVVEFPFPVKEKFKVGNAFDCRDLLYYLNSIVDYFVLSISKKHIHLFKGKGEEFREVKNKDFPLNYEETYEYSRSSRGTSFGNALKSFEKDKSVLQEVRVIDFLRTADHHLDKYIDGEIYLVVSGGKKEIADYIQITKHKKQIIGKVVGNYNFNGDIQLEHLSWKEVKAYLNDTNRGIISNLKELSGREMVAIGIEEVWEAANEGKGLELFVEKDLEKHAFVSSDGYDLKFRKPVGKKKYNYVNDIVEKTIELVREKHGKVTFIDNGEMKDFNGIALQLRYNNNQS